MSAQTTSGSSGAFILFQDLCLRLPGGILLTTKGKRKHLFHLVSILNVRKGLQHVAKCYKELQAISLCGGIGKER